MKATFSDFNEKLFSEKEISGIGTVGTMRLLRGKTAKFLNFLGRLFAYSPARSYGCFLFSFGLLSVFLNLGEYYFKSESEVSLSSLAVGAVLVILALPLLFVTRPMCVAVQDFIVTDKIFFDFFSMKRMHRNTEHPNVSPLVALFLGFIPAAVGYFVSVEWVVIALVILVLAAVALTSPEFSMIFTIVTVPYISLFSEFEILLAVMSFITFISYAIKVAIGKRVFNFDVYGVIAILIMLLILFGGVFGEGRSLTDSVVLVAIIMGYFPISNIVINRRLADSVINAVVISAIPITVVSIIEFVVELPGTSYLVPVYSTPGTSAFFSSQSALASFLMISSILTLVFVFEKRSILKRSFYGFVFAIEALVLVAVSLQPGAFVAAIFAVLAYSVIRSRKIPIDALILLIIIPHLVFLLPEELIDSIYGYLGLSYTHSEFVSECTRVLGTLWDNFWFGGSPGESNTALGIGAQLGVPALVLVLLSIIIRFRHLSYYRLCMRNSLVGVTGDMTAVAMVALFAYGAFEEVFSDLAILYIFITAFALSTAALRTAKKENDERLGYYGDSRSSDSSALDVSVNR